MNKLDHSSPAEEIVMPGSGVRAVAMVEKEAHLVDPFFDAEDDEAAVDMEMVYEAMKSVPLPDIEYGDQDYPISVDHNLSEPSPGRAIRAQPDPVVRQVFLLSSSFPRAR